MRNNYRLENAAVATSFMLVSGFGGLACEGINNLFDQARANRATQCLELLPDSTVVDTPLLNCLQSHNVEGMASPDDSFLALGQSVTTVEKYRDEAQADADDMSLIVVVLGAGATALVFGRMTMGGLPSSEPSEVVEPIRVTFTS